MLMQVDSSSDWSLALCAQPPPVKRMVASKGVAEQVIGVIVSGGSITSVSIMRMHSLVGDGVGLGVGIGVGLGVCLLIIPIIMPPFSLLSLLSLLLSDSLSLLSFLSFFCLASFR